MDWTEQLRRFREDNPDLPEGPETEQQPEPADNELQRARLDIKLSRKGRAGKTVTLVTGWQLDDQRLADVAARLKKSLGTGGSVDDDGAILIQGDRRADVLSRLTDMGFKARVI